ncbi:MAG: hypothetical protein LC742_01490, partial [Acidobacteria bacterium]|nr:hypothetical protein [Acidobacteriota bacterium]
MTDATKLVAGSLHSMALKSDGTVAAWGHNNAGQLADGTTFNRAAPVSVTTSSGVLSGITDITAGIAKIDNNSHSLALKSDGTVWSWGNNNSNALGNSTTVGTRSVASGSVRAVQVDVLTNVTAIAAGQNHSLALINGRVWTWGRNCEGQLGNGTIAACAGTANDVFIGQLTPAPIENLSDVRAIAAGAHHSLALRNDGTVWAWGSNDIGQLGDNTRINRATPVQVMNLSGIAAIAAGASHSLALRQTQTNPSDGTAFAWGSNEFGQLGNPSIPTGVSNGVVNGSNVPVIVMGLTGVTSIGAGGDHSLATVETRSISGRITQNGAPLAGVNVTLSGSPTTIRQTNSNGEYAFVNLTLHGDYTVTPSKAGLSFDPPDRTFNNLIGNQTTADFVATTQPTSESALSSEDVGGLMISNNTLTKGTLSQTKPVLDKSISASLENGRIVIAPASGAQSARFSGFVSKSAFDFLNRGVSVQVERTADDTGETIFSVGSDKDHWARFIIMEEAAAVAAGALAEGDIEAAAGNKKLIAQQKNGPNSPVMTVASPPYNPTMHQHLNISNSNGMTVFSSSANGMSWTAQAAVPASASASGNPSATELSAGTSSASANPGSAVFSNLSVGTAAASATTVQFERPNFAIGEGDGRATATITRSGDTTGVTTVGYRTIDNPAAVRCDDTTTLPGVAFARCDYATTIDTVQFAAGETSKTITIPLIDDA